MSEENDKKKDLTRIEDLSEFNHEDFDENDEFFTNNNLEESNLGNPPEEEEFTEFRDYGDRNQKEDLSSNEEFPEQNSFEADEGEMEDHVENEIFHNDDSSEFDDQFEAERVEEAPTNNETILEDNSEFNEVMNFRDDFADGETEIPSGNNDISPPEMVSESDFLEQESKSESEEIQKESKPVKDYPANNGHLEFNEIQASANQITYGNLELGNGPPFTVLIKITSDFSGDKNEVKNNILNLLKDLSLVSPDNLARYESSFQRDNLLISQINEFSAIILVHKLKNFPIEIEMGFATEVFEPKSYPNDDQSSTNDKDQFEFKNLKSISNEEVFVTTLNNPNNINAAEFLGPIQLIKKLSSTDLDSYPIVGEEVEFKEITKNNKIFDSMINDLKLLAIKKGGNAIINLKYQISPAQDKDLSDDPFIETFHNIYAYGDLIKV